MKLHVDRNLILNSEEYFHYDIVSHEGLVIGKIDSRVDNGVMKLDRVCLNTPSAEYHFINGLVELYVDKHRSRTLRVCGKIKRIPELEDNRCSKRIRYELEHG